MSDKKISKININQNFLNLLNSLERVCSGVFVLSSYIDEKDILGTELKKMSVKIIKDIYSVGHFSNYENVYLGIRELISLMRIACTTGHVSQRIFSLVTSELEIILSKIADTSSISIFSLSEENILDQTNGVPLPRSQSPFVQNKVKKFVSSQVISRGSLKDSKKTPEIGLEKATLPSGSQIATNFLTKESNTTSDRKSLILNVLKSNEKLTVKDFLAHIKDCSEKTIQRDLAALVAVGSVVREGERRWARYFVK